MHSLLRASGRFQCARRDAVWMHFQGQDRIRRDNMATMEFEFQTFRNIFEFLNLDPGICRARALHSVSGSIANEDRLIYFFVIWTFNCAIGSVMYQLLRLVVVVVVFFLRCLTRSLLAGSRFWHVHWKFNESQIWMLSFLQLKLCISWVCSLIISIY